MLCYVGLCVCLFIVVKAWEAVTCELVDEIILGFCFEMHRSCKRGTLFLDELDDEYDNIEI